MVEKSVIFPLNGIIALPSNLKSLKFVLGSRIDNSLSTEQKIIDFGSSEAEMWPLLDVRVS